MLNYKNKFVLDSDTITYIVKAYSRQVIQRFENTEDECIFTTSINVAEITYGLIKRYPYKSKSFLNLRNFLSEIQVVNFDYNAGTVFGEKKAKLEQKGVVVADMDLMIASISIANDAILITNNVRHFEKIPGLKLENWNE